MFQKKLIIILLSCLILTGCKSKNYLTEEVTIEDLLTIKQNHKEYVTEKNSNKLIIPKEYHKMLEKKYRERFLSPWKSRKASISKNTVIKQFKQLNNKNVVGENKKKIAESWTIKLQKNANLKKYPNYTKRGITIANTNLRLIPTHKPIFKEFSDNSNGYPFDNNQNSKLPANTPILITHITADNAWVLVETPYAFGWVPIRDIAYTGKKFIKAFKAQKKYIAITHDDFGIKTQKGTYLYQGFIGMSFPLINKTKQHYTTIVARANSSRWAYIDKAKIKITNAKQKPFSLTNKNIGLICDNLIDQPYGWGELYYNRDCSAMIRDLFAPFSIWLPRNSTAQAKHGGMFIDISQMPEDQKEDFIIENGIPYLTLLWFPGHIMLYIGEKENKSLIFHNIWGLRTKDKLKRKIIGKAVITSLKPGEELPNIDDSYNFLKRLKGMTLLIPRY
ncbi:hypothetical protein CL658_04915 [bacterium]|nr:hypothetical protein [bacterium]|tara:strand:- start:592 stop:1932 length:1341 start_codon:yes stop_codon:yes gene_type:complete